jgi:hypothetical protein
VTGEKPVRTSHLSDNLALQQAKGIPLFAKTVKSGAPAKSKIRFPSDLLGRNYPQVV